MRLGVLLPSEEIRLERRDIDEWVSVVAESGFDHVMLGDHVLGVDPAQAPAGWNTQWPGTKGGTSAYTDGDVFREPMVLFGYLAGTCTLELLTGVLVLPQRQTALLAKQAAEVDVLSGGRLRLGVGVGWNPMEFEALGVDFRTRGRLIEEQIVLLRRLWTESTVTFSGDFHRLTASGIHTLPVQRPIPLWMGGDVPAALDRLGRLGDGWIVTSKTTPEVFTLGFDTIRRTAERAGRDPAAIGAEPRLVLGERPGAEIAAEAAEWERRGATHLCVDTRFTSARSLDTHLKAIREAGRVLVG
jgi:probable F420-dependent oxidoreductase